MDQAGVAIAFSTSNYGLDKSSEYDVMKLAGHADFKTTHKFYLKVADDLVDQAREATASGLCQKLVELGMAVKDGDRNDRK